MRNAPPLVGGITMKSAAELIEDAAARDLIQALHRHPAKRIVLKKAVGDREPNRGKIVEARTAAAAEAARRFVIRCRQRRDYFPAEGGLVASGTRGRRGRLRDPFSERGGLPLHGGGVSLIRRRDVLQKRQHGRGCLP